MIERHNINLVKAKLDFWPHLTASEAILLLQHTETLRYSAGETLYSPSHACAGVLIVESGELRTYLLSEDGREITLFRLQKGAVCILSASCMIKGITFDVHIDAEQDTEVFLLDATAFAKVSSENIHVENFALKMAMDRFSDVMWAMEQILFMSFDRRLAVFLFDETAKTGEDSLDMTHEQIAKYMGSAREVVSRMLKHFAGGGIVELSRGHIRIMDREKLRKLLD